MSSLHTLPGVEVSLWLDKCIQGGKGNPTIFKILGHIHVNSGKITRFVLLLLRFLFPFCASRFLAHYQHLTANRQLCVYQAKK